MKKKSGIIKELISIIIGFTFLIIILLTNLIVIKNKSNLTIILLSISSLIFFFIIIFLISILFRKLKIIKALIINSSDNIENSNDEMFEVATILFDENQKIFFISPWLYKEGFSKYLGKNIKSLEININSSSKIIWKKNNRLWLVNVYKKSRSILLKDYTYVKTLEEKVDELQNAILLIHISYSEKLSFNESAKTKIRLKINQIMQDWTNKVDGLLNLSTNLENTFIIVFQWIKGSKEILNNTLLKKIKAINSTYKDDITISIGSSYGVENFSEMLNKSLKSLEISKKRGGDQIVIEKKDGELIYVGAETKNIQKNDNLIIKNFYINLNKQLKNSKEVFITSHEFADLDALGSSIGMMEYIKNFGKETWIILDQFDNTAQKLFKSLPKDIKDSFITEEDAMKKINKRSQLILIDTSIIEMSQAQKLFEICSIDNIFIIDHHRISEKTLKLGEDQSLILASASSASELIVEIFKISINNGDSFLKISNESSTSLLTGIHLDTKQLTKNTSSSTFDSISFLMKNGADVEKINEFFRPSNRTLQAEEKAIKNINKIKKGVIFTYIDESYIINEEDTSIIADNLLKYQGVEAIFVLAKVSKDKIKLSARSNNKFNVQIICEKLGGGGHFNSSAVSWKTTLKFNTIIKRTIDAIQKNTK